MKVNDFMESFNKQIREGDKLRNDSKKAMQKAVLEREQKIETLQAALLKLNVQVEENEIALNRITAEQDAEFTRLKENQAQLAADHKKGAIGLDELLAKKKKDHELEDLAREKFGEKIHLARCAASEVGKERLRILAEIETQQNGIANSVNNFFEKFVEILTRQKTTFEKYQRMGGRSATHSDNYSMVIHGFNMKKWEPKSLEEIQKIVTSGIIRPEHFHEFDSMLQDLRGIPIDFSTHKVVMYYHPNGDLLNEVGLRFAIYNKIKNEIIVVPTKKRSEADRKSLEGLTGRAE